jgi:hypothetical protein
MRRGYEPAKPHSGGRPLGARLPALLRPRTGPRGLPVAGEVGRFFQDLRRTFRLSQAQAAKRLATRIDIIAALEAGEVRGLPPWPETCRIVRTYMGLAGLDPRPVLNLIEILLANAASRPAPAPRRTLLAPLAWRRRPGGAARDRRRPLAGAAESLRRVWHGRFGQAGRALFAIAVPVALVVLLTQTSVLEAAVAKLPPSVVRIVRGAQNYVIVQLAPVRDGLRWIDVPDPRTRRSDKLRTTAQSD